MLCDVDVVQVVDQLQEELSGCQTELAETRERVEHLATELGRHHHTMQQGGCCCLLVGCLTSQQHASVSQGRICSDSFTCCHTEIEVADLTFHLAQSPYTDTRPTSPSTDPVMPGAWQGSHWSANI